MDELFGEVGMFDAFRAVDPREERYTWWSNRGRAWDNNTGDVVQPADVKLAR